MLIFITQYTHDDLRNTKNLLFRVLLSHIHRILYELENSYNRKPNLFLSEKNILNSVAF